MNNYKELKQKKPLKVDVAMMGARMHYAVPRLLYEAGILGTFYTDIYVGNKPWIKKFLEAIPIESKFKHKLLGRKDEYIPPEKVVSFDLSGLNYWRRQIHSSNSSELTKVYAQTGSGFNNAIVRKGLNSTNTIYGFNTASLELFEYAHERGIKCILEQTIAPSKIQRRLIFEEANRWPGWQPDLEIPIENNLLSEREEEEWKLAHLILGGSQFVKSSLGECGVSNHKSKVVPYGVSLENFKPAKKEPLSNRPLRVLFVGEVGLRKGIPYLLEALRLVNSKSIEVKLVGRISLASEIIDTHKERVEFLGSVPRNLMYKLYNWADLFVLPSICEGSATVTYEALASGIPVIATPNTGSPVEDGVDGNIVPIRDSETIAEILEKYRRNPALLIEKREAAISLRDKVSLQVYGKRLVEVICEYSSEKSFNKNYHLKT